MNACRRSINGEVHGHLATDALTAGDFDEALAEFACTLTWYLGERRSGGCQMADSCVTGVPLRTERLSSGRRRLLCALVVAVPPPAPGSPSKTITVPSGFDTDFSSLPTFLQWLVHWSKVDVAGVVHDWLYAEGGDRKWADQIWRTVALSGEHRANRLQAGICWLGLRVFGAFAWNRHARRREQEQRSGADPTP